MHRDIYKGRTDTFPDDCRAATWDGWHFNRCNNKGTVTEIVDGVEMKFCNVHSKAHMEAKEAKKQKKRQAEEAARERANAKRMALGTLLEAILAADHSTLPTDVQKAVLEYLEASK